MDDLLSERFLTSLLDHLDSRLRVDSGMPRRFHMQDPFAHSTVLWGLGLLLLLSMTGCVSRRVTVRSTPPGALVLLEGEKVGYTPVAFDITYYGTREITLMKPGYETLTVMQKMSPPWYQIPPLDFVSDNLLPFHLTNRQEYHYPLNPELVYPTQEILDRARQLRSESHLGP